MTILKQHDGAVYGLACSDAWLASTGEDGDVVLIERVSGESHTLLTSPPERWDHVHRLQWSGSVLHWASLSGHAGELSPGQAAMELPSGESRWGAAVENTLCDLAVGTDGTMVVTGGDGDGVIVLQQPNGERVEGTTYKWPYTVALSPSGRALLVGTWAGRVHLTRIGDPTRLQEQELEQHAVRPCFDGVWLDEQSVVVVGAARQGGAAVLAATVEGKVLWTADPGADALCAVRLTQGVAVGFSTGEVVVYSEAGEELERYAALEAAPGAPAPFPSNAEYFEVPPQAICSLATHGDALFVGLAGGVVRQLR